MSPQVELSNFVDYLGDNIKRLAALYREIEEVQIEFNSLYTGLRAEWQTLVEETASRLAVEGSPEPLRETLARYRAEERHSLEERITALKKEVTEKQKAADQTLQEAQAEIARLRELNPVLNEREESLKARSLSETAEIARLEQELRRAGFWRRLFDADEWKDKLEKARRSHDETLAALKAVREEWVAKKAAAEERQAELRNAWEALTVEISQAQTELDYLEMHLDELAAKRGAQRYLATLQEAPNVDSAWREPLARIAELNQELGAYQKGLTSVAEALGVLTGIRTGLERFQQSVDKVYEEQRQYNLQPLQLDLPRSVIQFHNTWAEFRTQVKNEKHLGKHPLEFVQVVKPYIQERLTETAIQQTFESMGRALNAATKAWD